MNVLELEPVFDCVSGLGIELEAQNRFASLHQPKSEQQPKVRKPYTIPTFRAAVQTDEHKIHNVPVFRGAAIGRNEFCHSVKKPIPTPVQKEKPSNDLRNLINQMKKEQLEMEDIQSDDSFHSVGNDQLHLARPREQSLSYIRDLIHAVPRNETRVIKSLLQIHLSTKIAESLTCSGYDHRLDVFQVCSILMTDGLSGSSLKQFLVFFGNVLSTVNSKTVPYGIKRLIEKRMDEFELYQRLVQVLDEVKLDKDFMNTIAKVVFFTTCKQNVSDLIRARTSFKLYHLIQKLHALESQRYLSALYVRYLRYLYEIRHEQPNTFNEAYHDLQNCDWLSSSLKKPGGQNHEDCLYALYFIMNKMPLSSVKAVFETNRLAETLMKRKQTYHQEGETDLELLTSKLSLFPTKGNFLTEKLLRSRVSESQPAKLPSKPVAYRGGVKSVADVDVPFESYQHVLTKQAYQDKRLDMQVEENRKAIKFIFGSYFSRGSMLERGFIVGLVQEIDDETFPRQLCKLLNSPRHGILILGVEEQDSIKAKVQGIHMTRKERDELRMGLKDVCQRFISPPPPMHRFGSLIFNPVIRHPKDCLLMNPEHFVIRLDVRAPEIDTSVIYKVKRII